MSKIAVDYNVLNQRGTPAWFTANLADIPTAGVTGRMFISQDTFAFYRDTGTAWDLIGGPGSGSITGSGASGQVPYFTSSSILASSSNFFWDNTNKFLGIGTSTPGQFLELLVSDGNGIRLNNGGSSNKKWDIILSGNDLRINELSVAAVMTFQAAGNVGINTTAPATKLHVLGPIRSQDSRGGSLAAVEISGGSSSLNPYISVDQSNPLTFIVSGAEKMRIDSSGCLNVGGISGFGKMDVCGQLNATTQNVCRLGNINGVNNGLIIQVNTSNNYIYSFGTLGTGTVTATAGTLSVVSDMNLKIEDGFINNALDKVMNLIPRYFLWKEESGLPTNIRQLGFYAQEVNQALGEEAANTPKDKNDKWGIFDRGMIAMLTKAIQELNEKLVKNNIN